MNKKKVRIALIVSIIAIIVVIVTYGFYIFNRGPLLKVVVSSGGGGMFWMFTTPEKYCYVYPNGFKLETNKFNMRKNQEYCFTSPQQLLIYKNLQYEQNMMQKIEL